MNKIWIILISILLIFIGEGLAICSELFGAKQFSLINQSFSNIFLKMFLVGIVAAAFLLSGYMLGFLAFKNIWIVSAVSITSILIIEPTLNWIIFKQIPTSGSFIGLILGIIGFIFALFLK